MVVATEQRRYSEETEEDSTSNSRSTSSEDAPPTLLNTLPLHASLYREYASDFDSHVSGNKLNLYTNQTTEQTTAFCQIVTLLPFSRELSGSNSSIYTRGSYENALAMMLAVQQLNTGDGSIVSEVDGLSERCPIQFSLRFVDTRYDIATALKEAIVLTQDHLEINTDIVNEVPACAFVGAGRSAVSGVTSIVTGMNDYVQLSGSSTSVELDDRSVYPRFARTIASDTGTAEALILFLKDKVNITHLAIVYSNDQYGIDYSASIRDAAQKLAPEMEIEQIPIDHISTLEHSDIEYAVGELRKSQFLFAVVILMNMEAYDAVMLEAYRQGLAGSRQHNFIFTDGFDSNSVVNREFEPGSPLYRAYSGAGFIRASGHVQGERHFDLLTKKLKEIKQSPESLRFAASMLPGNPSPLLEDDGFFNPITYQSTSFHFDAVILLGLSACAAVNEELILSGTDWYHQLPRSSFEGTTGPVILNPETYSREANSTFFNVWNLVPYETKHEALNTTKGTGRIRESLTSVFSDGQFEYKRPYIFSDGTSSLPESLVPPTVNTNPLHTGTRVVVLLFCGIAILAALACSVWTWYNRNTRIVRASQPFFLLLLCFGTILLAATIIPVSYGVSNASMEGLDTSCNSTVWLACLGHTIIFSALFSKTHRINTIMKSARKYRRIKVTIRDTLKPMTVMLSLNLLVLTLMTIMNPVQYQVVSLNFDQYDRAIETAGYCNIKGSMEFVIPLVILNMAVIFFALYEAWMARNLSTEFQESEYIFRATLSILMLFFIGVPVIILAQDTPNASVFIISAMVFVVCIDILAMMFIPKMQYKEAKKLHVTGLDVKPGDSNHQVCFSAVTTSSDGVNAFEDDSSSSDGERIIATKGRRELADEVAVLKRLLRDSTMRMSTLRDTHMHVDAEADVSGNGELSSLSMVAEVAPLVPDDDGMGNVDSEGMKDLRDSVLRDTPLHVHADLDVASNGK